MDIGFLCTKRLDLIDQLEAGLLTKEDFILENYKVLEPYENVSVTVSTVDEGILKYHYFNTKAKKMMLDADEIEFRSPYESNKLKNLAYDWYLKKDQVTFQLISMVEAKAMNAYFIHMNSRSLEGQIFEIDFIEHDRVVLHSKDRRILHKLKVAGCFNEERKASKIQTYVNTKIY